MSCIKMLFISCAVQCNITNVLGKNALVTLIIEGPFVRVVRSRFCLTSL